jgi:replicative DNA helicase
MLNGYDDWLQAQNCLLGAALINPELVPRVVSELAAEDFSGTGLLVYKAMADLFRKSRTNDEVDAVAVAHYLGDTPETRQLVANFMGCSPNFSEIDRYVSIVRSSSKLSQLRSMGADLAAAASLDEAEGVADGISSQLLDRPGLKGYGPAALLAKFEKRHKTMAERIPWKQRPIGDYIRLKKGQFIILGAEPSGGKTAFALEQLWAWSQNKRVLFVSLETDEDTVFDRQISSLTGIPMDVLMDGALDPQQWKKYQEARNLIATRTFKILPAAGLSVAGIKAAAIGFRADIIIIDYLQIVQLPGKRLSRYETITEISMSLHILAQSTGMIVVALSQVTNRDPTAKNSPLTIHSARESGQIEADADAILMLDKFVEKKLLESGCRANRILRIVKNKNGRCCNIPLYFDGRTQMFEIAPIPNPDWDKVQEEKKKKQLPESGKNFEQISVDSDNPF